MPQIPSSMEAHLSEHSFDCEWASQCPLSGLSHGSRVASHFICPQRSVVNLIGIPTTNGMEFLKAKEIIRCEGMQRLTKVYTVDGVIISSYNIGEFYRMLFPFGFFSPHKSHLINLQHLRSYRMDGVITLRDGSQAPLARRRREAFLERVRHL
ncbi:MAG: LytTR family DNA-binding domain-containing protein [Saprospiraceae bacterium]